MVCSVRALVAPRSAARDDPPVPADPVRVLESLARLQVFCGVAAIAKPNVSFHEHALRQPFHVRATIFHWIAPVVPFQLLLLLPCPATAQTAGYGNISLRWLVRLAARDVRLSHDAIFEQAYALPDSLSVRPRHCQLEVVGAFHQGFFAITFRLCGAEVLGIGWTVVCSELGRGHGCGSICSTHESSSCRPGTQATKAIRKLNKHRVELNSQLPCARAESTRGRVRQHFLPKLCSVDCAEERSKSS